jgi:hypothetical protein
MNLSPTQPTLGATKLKALGDEATLQKYEPYFKKHAN